MTEEILIIKPDGTQETVTREAPEAWVPGAVEPPENI